MGVNMGGFSTGASVWVDKFASRRSLGVVQVVVCIILGVGCRFVEMWC